MYTVYVYLVPPETSTPRLEIDYVLDLQHRPNKTDDTWAMVNYQLAGRVHDTRYRHSVVLLRLVDRTLWAATFEASTVDNTDDFIEFVAVRMVPCLAVAYVGADDRGEAMPVLGIKPPQLIRDQAVVPYNPDKALESLKAAARKHDPALLDDIFCVAKAIEFLTLRCIELQGPAENAERQS